MCWANRTANAVALLATLVLAVHAASPAAAAPSDGLPASQGGPFVGVWTGSTSPAEGAALDELGAGWARMTVPWSSVEPAEGTFAWASLDKDMALASGNGRRSVLALVRENPVWAAASRCTLSNEDERQHLAAFMGTLARRYRGIVWQFYNEMDNTSQAADTQYDLGGCFGTAVGGVPTATGRVFYARALEAVSAAIRGADPTAQVATGGIASGNFVSSSGGAFDPGFLPGVLAQLKADNLLSATDYVSIHFYSSQEGTYAASGTDLLGRVAQLRQDVLAAGLTSSELKPVLSDELSYTGAVGASTSNSSDPFNLAQRAYVPKVLARAAAVNLRAAFWFWLQDARSGLGADNAYGLQDLAGGAKPSYRAMRYFNSLIKRRDQFVRSLDLSGTSPKLEGYEFTTADGQAFQIVWNQQDATQIAYGVQGTVTSVADPEGNAVAVGGGSVAIGPEPRFIFYTSVPATPLFASVSIGLLAADPLVPGQPATLTLVVLNSGAIDATSTLTVLDTLPPELTFGGAVADGWTCTSDDGQLVTCSSASALTAGSLAQIQLLINTSTDATGLVTNTATVNSPSLDPGATLPTTVDTLQIADADASGDQ